MKVLITTPDLKLPGGVANYYSALRGHFMVDFEYFIVGRRNDRNDPVRIVSRLVRDYGRFVNTLRSKRYDLVHINPSLRPGSIIRDGLFLLIAKAFQIPTVVFFHGWDIECERFIRKFGLSLFRFVYFKANATIVLATDIRAKILEFGFHNPIYLETTTVSDDAFSRMKGGLHSSETASQDSRFNILFLSRIMKSKGIYETIQAYRLLKVRFPQVTLTIAGDGPELEAAEELVRSQSIPDVAFTGYVRGSAKQTVFDQADVYILPTYYGEGMPISLLEAMAYGLPVVTRPIAGIKDIFRDGETGFMTSSEDPVVFARLLETLIRDRRLCSRMGEFNRTFAEEHFAPSKVCRRLEDIYHAVSAGKAHPNPSFRGRIRA